MDAGEHPTADSHSVTYSGKSSSRTRSTYSSIILHQTPHSRDPTSTHKAMRGPAAPQPQAWPTEPRWRKGEGEGREGAGGGKEADKGLRNIDIT